MWRHGYGDMETWTHGDGDIETWRHRDMDMENPNGKSKPRGFSLMVYHWLIVQTEVCLLSFADGNKWRLYIHLETD
jgi:hypothetical protein